MHRGRYRLGDEFRLTFLCKSSSGVPTDPDAAPAADVYGPSGLVSSGKLVPPEDRAATTGLFSYSVFLGPGFTAGDHQAVIRYLVGGTHGMEEFSFEVVGGGDDSGAVLSLYNYERAHARFLVQQRADGGIYKGANPRAS